MTGSLTYVLPLVLGTALVAIITSRRALDWTTILAVGVLAFVAGGFNETYAGVQLIAIGSALLGSLVAVWHVSRRSRTLLISGCLGTFGALLAICFLPEMYSVLRDYHFFSPRGHHLRSYQASRLTVPCSSSRALSLPICVPSNRRCLAGAYRWPNGHQYST